MPQVRLPDMPRGGLDTALAGFVLMAAPPFAHDEGRAGDARLGLQLAGTDAHV